jgi:predicted ATPase
MPKYRVESQKKLPQELSDAAKRIHYFKAEGGVISEPSYTTEVPPRMSEHGLHLASVVANMIGSEPERFEEMLDAFRSVIPSIKRILTRRREITIKEQRMIVVNRKEVPFEEERTVAGDELIFDTVAGRLPMQAMSEGTMMALAILTQVYAQDGSAVLLLDDIEQGLHAKAQHELISQLRKIQKRRTDLQIILSTHSPFIIDEMTADEIWLLHSTNETGAKARKLSEHPDSERALKVLSTGEFWSAEGEEWVVEPTAK